MNKMLLVGRLVADPELNKTSSGKSLLRINLAVKRRYKNASGEKDTDFISLVFWEKLAEHCTSYAKKGALLAVEGEIRTRSYVDKHEQKRYVTEVLVKKFDLLESRATIAMRQDSIENNDLDLKEDELPF
ncbi:single-stranded DNA-binding protein [Lactococcus formosensis]|jgi:single stranded DNA-binding protein (ssb)|uniref:Single-stranded DNA-binding protein n=1 Tax=Lactococcus formosensis TaxID=1281486 RepID=A0A9Q8Y358_9LACT|nr:single-stranded DNA-binding protein [Lactococcus formosensis]MCO7179748.1 single-stranded DNA-binding protein [Lactococcus formosensis]MDG6110840.1 single-stranded DNA-binding protein [Lactococcus formosensis]MDG6116910.1 single-stranded DNA-binding protein [Lactococcus formosensis]MDG6119113.1 single-stranded DNA-binding protein [Lactococcus formosensis]MDG6125570.1 single-stranded DNA-binding protein [Lactococcus formosensis]